jgi:hypothetical protein
MQRRFGRHPRLIHAELEGSLANLEIEVLPTL